MQSRSSQSETVSIAETETYQVLLARAKGRTAGVPAERIVRHVLSVTHGGDWPVRRDALDAALRRCASAHTDEIQIVGRPPGGLPGLYGTRRAGSRARPYRTLLRRSEPLDGSCDCADFLRNSLGLCKHLIAVLAEVISKPGSIVIRREAAPAPGPRPLRGGARSTTDPMTCGSSFQPASHGATNVAKISAPERSSFSQAIVARSAFPVRISITSCFCLLVMPHSRGAPTSTPRWPPWC